MRARALLRLRGNDDLSVGLVLDKGADIVDRRTGVDVLFRTPWKLGS